MTGRPRISPRAERYRPSLTLELKRIAASRAAKGLPVWDFGLGETKGDLAAPIRDAGSKAFLEEQTQYGNPAGVPELRQAVLRWLDLTSHYTPDDVVITGGAKQSLFNVFLAVCSAGDTVLVDSAPWVSYLPMIVAADAEPVVVHPAAGARNYLKTSAADLEREIDAHPSTRLFLINSPVNPTSQVYSAAELEALLAVCVERKVFFVLDRLYWRLVFDGEEFPAPRVDAETKPWLIQIDGLSKNFRRTGGIRIGWSVAPSDVTRAMINLQSHFTSGPPIPAQLAALAGITTPYDPELLEDLERKRNLLREATCNIPQMTVWPTAGAFYSFWDVKPCLGKKTPSGAAIGTSEDLATYLLETAGVVTAPGSAFCQEGYLRISFATPDEHIVNGCRAVGEALAALR